MPFKILVVIALLVIVLLISLKKPIIGLLFYLALMFIRPQDDRPNIADLHLPYIMILALTILYFVKLNTSHTLIPKTNLFKPFVYFFILMSVSAFLAENQEIALTQWEIFIVNIVTFVFIYAFITSENDLKIVSGLLVLCGLYFCYLAIFNGSDCIQTIDGLGCGRRNFVKVNINFGQPNYLGLTMAVMFFITIPFLLEYRSKLIKLAIFLCLICFIFILMKTNSRGAAIAFSMSFLYFIFRKPKRGRNYLILFTIIIATISFIPHDFLDRISTLGDIEDDQSAMSRVELWRIGFKLIENNPVFGVGIGNFQVFAPNSPHNAYLQVASEMGLIAFFVWIWLMKSALKTSEFVIKAYKTDKSKFVINSSLCLKVSIITVLMQGMTTGLAHRELLYVLVALLAAVEKLTIVQYSSHKVLQNSIAE